MWGSFCRVLAAIWAATLWVQAGLLRRGLGLEPLRLGHSSSRSKVSLSGGHEFRAASVATRRISGRLTPVEYETIYSVTSAA